MTNEIYLQEVIQNELTLLFKEKNLPLPRTFAQDIVQNSSEIINDISKDLNSDNQLALNI